MTDSIKLDLVTPERKLISTEVEEMVAKAFLGEFGVLPGHANYVTLMEPGELSFLEKGEKKLVVVTGGFAEVSLDNGIRIMADAAEFAEEIDVERAKEAKERAERRISDFDPASQEIDILRAEAALKRSLARIQVVERIGD